MSRFRRSREPCRRDHQGQTEAASADSAKGQEPSGRDGLERWHLEAGEAAGALGGIDPRLTLNRVFLNGVLVADPQEVECGDGDAMTLLLMAVPAPDPTGADERLESFAREIEVPDHVAERHGRKLRAGISAFVIGQLTAKGAVMATEIHTDLSLKRRSE